MTTLEFIVFALATYRLTRLIIRDEVFSRPRNFIWRKFPPESNKFGYLFTCPWCISIWAALLLQISSIIIPEVTYAIQLVLAASAVGGLLTAHEER